METLPVLLVVLCLAVGLVVGLAGGLALGQLWFRRTDQAAQDRATRQQAVDRELMREDLARLQDQLRDLERHDASWQGRLSQQMADVGLAADALRRETHTLAGALRRPTVRGRWGELHLRRVVELAGLVDQCDFEEQVHVTQGSDGAAHDGAQPRTQHRVQRPDLVVHLAGGRQVVVDAKVPLDAFLDAAAATDDDARSRLLEQHARQVRQHVGALATKAYWRSFDDAPEFVVLFLPSEAVLAAALEADRRLIEDASARQVVLAGPTTLIALLRTVALGWTQQRMSEQAREIHHLGRELHARLSRMTGHLDQVGRSLEAAVGHYNRAVGSLESRVLVSARRLGELGLGEAGPRVKQVELAPRSVATTEGTTALHESRRAGPAAEDGGPSVGP